VKTVQKVLAVGVALTIVSFCSSAGVPLLAAGLGFLVRQNGLSASSVSCFGCALVPFIMVGAFFLLRRSKKH
jgi:hypothetical protein